MKISRRNILLSMAAVEMLDATESKDLLSAAMTAETFRGRLDPDLVAALMSSERLSRDALMLRLLPVARKNAHPPISNYFVGAVALGRGGSFYFGQNIEIPGNMLGLAVHAEQAAIANAYMSNESGIEAIAVTAAPCGHCRQFLSEASPDLAMRVLIPNGPRLALSALLPHAFGPRDLGLKSGAFPVVADADQTTDRSFDGLSAVALKAAIRSYCPYSKSPSGVALRTSSGRIFAGSYIENAAFNPSLPPLEAALAGYFAAGRGAGEIRNGVLLERKNNVISHEVTTRSVLSAISPGAQFERIQF